ncbi:MAG: hypothetical protein J6Q00_00950, partial [Verrucomicrobia bacterium]|nr:hypothetical protein [Verrucomicrobiota bacterium]
MNALIMNNFIRNLTKWVLITVCLICSFSICYAGATISFIADNSSRVSYCSVKTGAKIQVGDYVGTDFIATHMYGNEVVYTAVFTLNSKGIPTGRFKSGTYTYDNLPAGETVIFHIIAYDRGYIDHPSSGDYYYGVSENFT